MTPSKRGKPKPKPRRKPSKRIMVGVLVCLTVLLAGGVIAVGLLRAVRHRTGAGRLAISNSLCPVRVEDLMVMAPPTNFLDLAEVSFACAAGLPGAETMDAAVCREVLATWTDRVRQETEKRWKQFKDRPDYYENSEAKYRMIQLVLTLQQDCRIHYKARLIAGPAAEELRDPSFFANAGDVFIHGLLGPERAGTCSSMPVLVATIGRRLGYPLRLVSTKAHLFLRWDGGARGETCNIECTGKGVDFFPDDHYRKWPVPFREEEGLAERYLVSLTPAEEVGLLLQIRAFNLAANNRHRDAVPVYRAALRYSPSSANLRRLLVLSVERSNAGR
jgi:hypothetical protein